MHQEETILSHEHLERIVSGALKQAKQAHGEEAAVSSVSKRAAGLIRGWLMERGVSELVEAGLKEKLNELERQIDLKDKKIVSQGKAIADLVQRLKQKGKLK